MKQMAKEAMLSMIRPVTDALYVLNGKWKLPILICLTFQDMRFRQLASEIPRITDRMLAKELRELEANLLIERITPDTGPSRGKYSLTEYGRTLHSVVLELNKWGTQHRKVIAQHW